MAALVLANKTFKKGVPMEFLKLLSEKYSGKEFTGDSLSEDQDIGSLMLHPLSTQIDHDLLRIFHSPNKRRPPHCRNNNQAHPSTASSDNNHYAHALG